MDSSTDSRHLACWLPDDTTHKSQNIKNKKIYNYLLKLCLRLDSCEISVERRLFSGR